MYPTPSHQLASEQAALHHAETESNNNILNKNQTLVVVKQKTSFATAFKGLGCGGWSSGNRYHRIPPITHQHHFCSAVNRPTTRRRWPRHTLVLKPLLQPLCCHHQGPGSVIGVGWLFYSMLRFDPGPSALDTDSLAMGPPRAARRLTVEPRVQRLTSSDG